MLLHLYDKLKHTNVIRYWSGTTCTLDVIPDDLFYTRVSVLLKLRVCFPQMCEACERFRINHMGFLISQRGRLEFVVLIKI